MEFYAQDELSEFYAQDKLNELYEQMRQKPYSKKEEWEKFLSDSYERYSKKQKKIKKYEILVEDIDHIEEN